MTYCFYWKHADRAYKHESLVNALTEYFDAIDNRGLELWIEDDPPLDQVHYRIWRNEAACGLMLTTADEQRITRNGELVTCPSCREQVEFEREGT